MQSYFCLEPTVDPTGCVVGMPSDKWAYLAVLRKMEELSYLGSSIAAAAGAVGWTVLQVTWWCSMFSRNKEIISTSRWWSLKHIILYRSSGSAHVSGRMLGRLSVGPDARSSSRNAMNKSWNRHTEQTGGWWAKAVFQDFTRYAGLEYSGFRVDCPKMSSRWGSI